MNKNTAPNFFLIILLFALLAFPSTIAVPSSRSLMSSTKTLHNQHLYNEFQIKGRNGVEIEDYSGTGANNHHDPSPPGTS
ncbi:hypothetical protein ACJIZ3_021006 [Penstemon smallii]|uniref:Transmembrane protein n=1 Tax=Penstemon smallii TaxID=265156 RepID=A0ABD3SKZ8_9LAMI